jgi:hypothetical protein
VWPVWQIALASVGEAEPSSAKAKPFGGDRPDDVGHRVPATLAVGLRGETGQQDVEFRGRIAFTEQGFVRSKPREVGQIVRRGELRGAERGGI